VTQIETITSAWVHRYNNDRLMHRTGLRPPAEADAAGPPVRVSPNRAGIRAGIACGYDLCRR